METTPFGRPTLYKSEYAKQVYKLCLLGATDKEMADFFGVAESTLNKWKLEHPDFSESIKRGKITADANVAKSLYKKATGYTRPEVKVFQYEGSPVIVPVEGYYPPDTAAINIWLKNRRGKVDQKEGDRQRWADRQEVDVTTNGESLNQAPDLSTLTNEELTQYIALQEKVTPKANNQ